jgi:hypothetical protein
MFADCKKEKDKATKRTAPCSSQAGGRISWSDMMRLKDPLVMRYAGSSVCTKTKWGMQWRAWLGLVPRLANLEIRRADALGTAHTSTRFVARYDQTPSPEGDSSFWCRFHT